MIKDLYKNKNSVLPVLLLILVLSLTTRFNADGQERKYQVALKNTPAFIPQPNARPWLDSFAREKRNVPVQVLVQLYEMPDAALQQQLKEAGIQLLSYVGGNAYVGLVAAELKQTEALSAIRSITTMRAAWKTDPSIQVRNAKTVTVQACFYAAVTTDELEKWVARNNGTITDRSLKRINNFKVTLPAGKLNAFAAWYGVKYIGHEIDVQPLNFESRNATDANTATLPVAFGGYGLTGEGVTLGVGDNVSALYHIDTKDRVINFNPSPYTDHGQHTNGTAGGAGTIDPKGEGFAPHVRLLDMLYDLVVYETPALYSNYNMTVTNNSYAAVIGNCSYAGSYDVLSEVTDQITQANPYVLQVFASGNDGTLSCAPYSNGFATVTGGYQPAKNILVVGNSDKRDNTFYNSSCGPVKDGRLKPEIAAIGTAVYSTKGVDNYLAANGTSMACPNVSGAAVLLTERYKQLFSGSNPKSDLLKCLLMNGATDMGNTGPDFRFGFGLMNLDHSIKILETNRYTTNSVSQGGQNNITIAVPANTAQVKVMLYWHDTAASPFAVTQLVNDLDLTVTEPSSTVHQPLILDPSPAGVNNLAVEGADHLNNVEQVTINNPAAGNYTVSVKGFAIPAGSIPYVVCYDFIPNGVKFTYPTNGAAYPANDSMRIYWEASNDTNPFTLEFSQDNGGTWTTINNNINASYRCYTFFTPNISAQQCKYRLTRNTTGQQAVSGTFVINPQPVVQLSSNQCPGYLAVEWNAVPNATAYEVLRKKGLYLQAIDTITSLNYTFGGLSTDSFYYVSVRPFINGVPGWRSKALRAMPNTGNCSGSISDGDLAIVKILSLGSGRKHTSTALTSTENVSLQVRNLDDNTANNYKISWKINNGAWQSQTFNNTIPGNSVTTVNIAGFDFSAPGSYTIKVAIQNLAMTDPVTSNDSVQRTIRQLNNDSVNFGTGYLQDFESAGSDVVRKDTLGVVTDEHWDFNHQNDTSRLRFNVSPDITISGNRSASLDLEQVLYTPAANYLTGTFNAVAYDTAHDEVRLEFDYKIHGRPKYQDGNQAWVRGNDLAPWVKIYDYDTTQNQGQVVNSGSISLTTALAQAGQNFSSSMQVRLGQNDTAVIAANDYGNGVTLDNIKLYTVKNDVALLDILLPDSLGGCSLSNQEPLSVQIYNNYNQPQTNVQIFYRLDNGNIQNETIASIAAKDTVVYNFNQKLDLSAVGNHTLNVWLVATGDTYPANDSINNYNIRNQPLIATFPYLENFENGDGSWYGSGRNSSWAYGTPAAQLIHKAASGTKAWKTNLTGYYNNSERSYLYSPCFDVSSLNNPMLSMSMALDIENCGESICDQAYVEYATNDSNWTRLGATGQGTNWYDTANVWNREGFTRWHVASVALPKLSQPIRLRIALSSDQGTTKEGIAIDDIHIFDLVNPVYDGTDAGPISQTPATNQWNSFIKDGKLLVQLNPGSQSLGTTNVNSYNHTDFYDRMGAQYYFPENFVVNTSTSPTDSVLSRFYINESDVVKMVNGSGCDECFIPEDAYSLGITKYEDPVVARENGSLDDNLNGTYTYIPYTNIRWVPYDKGYYAEVNLHSFSEIWFNDGALFHLFPLQSAPVVFDANKATDATVLATWSSLVDTAMDHYELQRSSDGSSFNTIYTANSLQQVNAAYSYTDTPTVAIGSSVYYRVQYFLRNNDKHITTTKKIDWTAADQLISLYPNPVTNGNLNVSWTANGNREMQVSVLDITGRVARKFSARSNGWSNNTVLNVSGISTGMYIVHVIIGGNDFQQKIIIRY